MILGKYSSWLLLALFFLLSSLLAVATEYGDHHYCVDSEGGANTVKAGIAGYLEMSVSPTPSSTDMERFQDYCQKGSDKVTECAGEYCFAEDYYCVPLSDGRQGYNIYGFDCTKEGFTGCENGACTTDIVPEPVSCTDRTRNQDEVDIDCGGKCPKCGIGKRCASNSDCESNWCYGGICSTTPTPTCKDNIRNRDESDVDCGGLYCPLCGNGKRCITSADCRSSICDQDVCAASLSNRDTIATCTDNDGGENYFTKGETTGYNRDNDRVVTWADYCTDAGGAGMDDGIYLYEAVCQNNEVRYVYDIRCEHGCHSGACRREAASNQEVRPASRRQDQTQTQQQEPAEEQQESQTETSLPETSPVRYAVVQPQAEQQGLIARMIDFFRGNDDSSELSATAEEANPEATAAPIPERVLEEQRITGICKSQIREVMSGFFASCESRFDDNFVREGSNFGRYGSCKRYCEEVEGKTCLNSVVYYNIKIKKGTSKSEKICQAVTSGDTEDLCAFLSDDSYDYYPIYRSVGCGYEYDSDTYSGIRCICCSFPS